MWKSRGQSLWTARASAAESHVNNPFVRKTVHCKQAARSCRGRYSYFTAGPKGSVFHHSPGIFTAPPAVHGHCVDSLNLHWQKGQASVEQRTTHHQKTTEEERDVDFKAEAHD